jgi:integrase
VRVTGNGGGRKYVAQWIDRDGVRRTRTLGSAHVRDSGRRTVRGAIVWRAGHGPCPPGALTPKTAEEQLHAILEATRRAPRKTRVVEEPADRIPTFGDAIDMWLTYLEKEKRRKASTLQDARNVANAYLLPHFGADTPLYASEVQEFVVIRDGREQFEKRQVHRDTFATEDVDEFRRDLLDSHLSPRTVQKILVLLHGVFKLAKRRGLISTNPSEDAERVALEDAGVFNVLEPVEFERVYRAVLGELDERPADEREEDDDDAIDALSDDERLLYAAALSASFYAGLRMGEKRDLPWRNVDAARSMIRVESGFTHGSRSTPKGKRARSTPLVDVLAERLAALRERPNFTAPDDYVFCNETGERISDDKIRAVFYAALDRAGFGHRREKTDRHGNPQTPMRVHDLRHSWCTWAVNVWPVTKVQLYAGHRDIKTTMRYVHHQTKEEDAELGGAYLARVLGADAVDDCGLQRAAARDLGSSNAQRRESSDS